MVTRFWDNLLYKDWLLQQLSAVNNDIIFLLRIENYYIGKIRTFIPPSFNEAEKLLDSTIEHDGITIKIEMIPDDIYRVENTFEIEHNLDKIFYTYCHNFNPDYMNSAFRYITLVFDIKLSKIDFNNMLIDNVDISTITTYFGLNEYKSYPKAKYIIFR